MADVVEDLLALGGEVVHALVALGARGGDAAVEAVEVELEALELELGRRGLELAGADDELGDQAGERLVARRQLARRGAQAAAQVLGGAARCSGRRTARSRSAAARRGSPSSGSARQ